MSGSMEDQPAPAFEKVVLERLDHVVREIDSVVGEMGQLKGRALELRVRLQTAHFLRGLLVPARVLELEDVLAVLDLGAIDPGDVEMLERLDLIAEGTPRAAGPEPGGPGPVYLAAEISWRADAHDVRRAADRGRLLATGARRPVLPAVLAEDEPGQHLVELARELGVALVDGDGAVLERGRIIAAPTDL